MTEIQLTEKQQAEALHKQITGYGEVIYQSLYGMCTAIKQMRDSKLYRALGHSTFESYAQDMLGMTASQTYRYIKIADNLSADFVESTPQIGIQKLYLLAMTPEETRNEIVENTDLAETTVRELKMKLAQAEKSNELLTEQVSEAEQKAADAKKSEMKALGRVSVLETDAGFQRQKIEQLEQQVQELESRPVEVAVPVVDHEKENLMKAMQKLNTDTAVRMQEIQNEHSRHVIDLNRQHTAELEQVRQEYESRLAAIPAAVTDEKAVFKAFLANLVDSGKRLIAYLASNPNPEFSAQAAKTFDTMKQEVTNGTTV